jgi:type I restriction enzyme, S subunit
MISTPSGASQRAAATIEHRWYGPTPSAWAAAPLKQSIRVVGGGTPSKSDESYWLGDIPWASPKDIKVSILLDTEDHISARAIVDSATQVVPMNSVLVVFRSGILRHSLPSALAGRELALNQDLKAFICGPHLAPRYLRYLLAGLGQRLLTLWRKEGATVESLDLPRVLRTVFPHPPMHEQQVIVEYLDRETARIDGLIQKREQMVELVAERDARAFQDAVERRGPTFPLSLESGWRAAQLPVGWRLMHLSQALVQLTNGYVGPTRDILVEDGIPYIQSLHIKEGHIDFERRPFFVEPAWHYERPRIHLRAGDVLIVQTGDIGQVAVVPEGFGQASCHALQIARVRRDLLTGDYLAAYLRAPFGYHSLLCRATGALHPHLEAGIKDIPVLIPPRAVQEEILVDLRREQARNEATSEKLIRQLALLRERRDAVISAAVTAQTHIPEAA